MILREVVDIDSCSFIKKVGRLSNEQHKSFTNAGVFLGFYTGEPSLVTKL